MTDYSVGAVALIFSVPALGGFLFGYDIGATSYAIVQLESAASSSGVSWSSVVAASPIWQGMIVSATSAGAFIGSSITFSIADTIGRRMELRYASILYIVGALIQSFVGLALADALAGLALAVLILGRLVYGIGIGFAMHGAPTYLGEMVPSSIRGPLVSMKEVCIVFGILMGYVLGYALSSTTKGWVWQYAATLFASVAMLGLSYMIPWSARWLMLQNRHDEALAALQFLYTPEVAQQELNQISESRPIPTATTRSTTSSQEDAITSVSAVENTTSSSLLSISYRPALMAGIGLVVLQQVTGQPSVLSYATPIFEQAGLASYSSVLVALFKLVATLFTTFNVEKQGRKVLLYVGCSIMLLALIVLTVAFGFGESSDSEDASGSSMNVRTTSILVAMFLYIGGYQVGFGPIAWLLVSEVFPLEVRGQAVAVAVQANFLGNAIVQFGVPVIQSWIGLTFTFGIFAVLTLYSIFFVWANVPETKGLSLEEIEETFRRMRQERVTLLDLAVNGAQPEREALMAQEEAEGADDSAQQAHSEQNQ